MRFSDDELVCDGCAEPISEDNPDAFLLPTHNIVQMNGATYDLCMNCYEKLTTFFNAEIL